MPSPTRLNVAVCGGGIGGLTCALALSKIPGITVDLYEGASQFGEVGAGIGVWPRPWRILKQLGLEHDLLQYSPSRPRETQVPSFQYRKSDQPRGVYFHTLTTTGSLMAFARPDFQKVLVKHLPASCRTHFSKRLRSYTQSQSGPIHLLFEDGSSSTCNLLVGADGIHSSVRKSMLRQKAKQATAMGRRDEADQFLSSIEPVWSGTVSYRTVVPGDKLRSRAPGHPVLTTPMQYLGKNANIVAYPIAHGKLINVAIFQVRPELEGEKYPGPWVAEVSPERFMGPFSHWEPEVQALLGCVDKCMNWAVHTVKPMRSFVHERVALIGDAAHAMSPFQGSGAGQAIEDAYLLATVIGHHRTTSAGSVPAALQVYDRVRRPFAQQIAQRSRVAGMHFSLLLDGVTFEGCGEAELMHRLKKLSSVFVRDWEWAWTTTLDGALEDACMLLDKSPR